MCLYKNKNRESKLIPFYNSDGEITVNEVKIDTDSLPEHVDDPFLNTHVQYDGVLGFRYKTKMSTFTVYSTVETKTFCILMKLEPLR